MVLRADAGAGRFFHEMTQGVPAREAFRHAFDTDEATLEKELRDYTHRSLFNYKRIPVKPESRIEARVTPLTWPALAHNRFVGRYNEAIELVNAGKLEEGRAILQDLAADAPKPEQAESARKVVDQIDGILKVRKGTKKKP